MVLQIKHPIRRAAAGAFVTLALASSVFAQESTVCAATAPVVDTVQGVREYLGSIWHASDSTRLAVKKAELDRRTDRLAREYATYNGDIQALDRAEWAASQGGVGANNPILNRVFPRPNYSLPDYNIQVGPQGAPNVGVYINPNTGLLFNAPLQGPPNPAPVRQAPVQQYQPAQSAPTTYYQQLPTAENYAVAQNAPAGYAPQTANYPSTPINTLPPGYTSASANGGPVNYAPAQYAPFQYGAVPNANANYAPVNAASPQLTNAAPVAPNTNAVPPVMQQQFAPAQYAPSQQVAPGYGLFPQPAPQGVPRGNAIVPPNPTNGGAF